MNEAQSFASYVVADSCYSWEIPESWTFEDAATVSVVYSTVVQALQVDNNSTNIYIQLSYFFG